MFIDGSDGNRINDTMAHKVGREHLPDGGVAIIEGTLPPGGFIGPRTHTREDEITYVIEGEMTFDVGGIRHVAVAGAYVVKLRGVPHAFWNPSDRSARLMEIHAPGGFERFYDDMERVMSDQSMGEDERFKRFLSPTALYEVEHDLERGARLRAELGLP